MLNKPAAQITEADLQLLIADSVSERRNIDYKRDLPGTSDGDKKEFLADVSSFANALGGFLIFGMIESGGFPRSISGTNAADLDREAQRINNILTSGLQPRVRYELAWVSTAQGPVLVIDIERSLVGPHRVIFADHGHFYARNSTGKYRLDVSDLRQAFGAGTRLFERIRDFQADRLINISREEMPVPDLPPSGKVVVHIVPLTAFDADTQLDLRLLLRGAGALPPMELGVGWGSRFNYDGATVWASGKPCSAYTHVYWSGAMEVVEASILMPFSNTNLVIPGQHLEECVVGYTHRCLGFLERLGVTYPTMVMLALTGVKGYKIALNQYTMSAAIDRDTILFPRAMINSATENSVPSVAGLLRPAFDRLWHSCGRGGSPHFDDQGAWKLTAKLYP